MGDEAGREPDPAGALVAKVVPDSAAAEAGIKVGDIINSVDGKSIKDGNDLVDIISARHPGSTAKLGYLRNGEQQSATVTIQDRTKTVGSLTGQNNAPNENGPGEEESGPDKLGVTEDVLGELKISLVDQLLATRHPSPGKTPALDKEYKILLDALAFEPASVDTLMLAVRRMAG